MRHRVIGALSQWMATEGLEQGRLQREVLQALLFAEALHALARPWVDPDESAPCPEDGEGADSCLGEQGLVGSARERPGVFALTPQPPLSAGAEVSAPKAQALGP